MCSTPPPITATWTPAAISAAPKMTGCHGRQAARDGAAPDDAEPLGERVLGVG
jgi:hypothetical protein